MRKSTTLIATGAMLVAAAFSAPAPSSTERLDLAVEAGKKALANATAPIVGDVANRPAILLETDSYVYGPGTNFTAPEVTLNLDSRGFSQPTTVYLYWQNRENGSRMYYNVAQGLTSEEVDLFSVDGSPAQVFVPDLTDFKLFGANSAFGSLPGGVPTSTGLYQFVLEIRDAEGEDVLARGNAMYNFVDGVAQHSGQINGSEIWSNDQLHLLATPVNVMSGTLTIEPGTVVFGSNGGQGTLIIHPGARIDASGDAMRPIIFTSEFPVGQRAAGDWGGVVISGDAPTNQQNPIGEGDSGAYGGDNPNDSSGTLSYVRVEFAGILFSDQNELNGIALQGVGSGTQLDHLQVHHNQDDGIEFFGGTANAKYVLITDANDDSLDWTFGWTGKLQHFVAIQQHTVDADNGTEADNFEDNPSAEPRSDPTVCGATFIGNTPIGGDNGNGILWRRGTSGTHRNYIIQDFQGFCVEYDNAFDVDASHFSVFNCDGGASNDPGQIGSLLQQFPNFINARTLQPDVTPRNTAVRNNFTQCPGNGFFDAVNWAGGVNPNDPWINDYWTTFSDD